MLLINSTGDPATPYAGAVATPRMMPNSRLVTVPVSHHAVLGEYPSLCVEQAAVAYLTEGVLRDRFCLLPFGGPLRCQPERGLS